MNARVALALVCVCMVAGCRSASRQPQGVAVRVDTTTVLPNIPVYEIAGGGDTPVRLAPVRSRDPLSTITSTKRVSLTASNQDVRILLLWLAEQAGTSLVLSPDVNARVTVAFRDVPVVDAIRAVMLEAGLSVLIGPMEAPWPPVVFYQLPVNVNFASAEVIAARFGVSLELAKFMIDSRPMP